jgi:hypothetical protein
VVKNVYLYDSGGELPYVKPWKCDMPDEFAICEENKNVNSINA